MSDEFREEESVPSAPYTVQLKNGRFVLLEDLPDRTLRSMAHKNLASLRKQITRVCAMKAELDRREYRDSLASFHPFRDYNIFQIMTHATMLGVNNFNRLHPELALPNGKKKEDEEE